MSGEDPLRARYLRRLHLGILLLLALGLPAAFDSHAAISSLFNRPGDWIPDSLPEKQEFNDFLDHFTVAELIMVGWEESELDAPSLNRAAELLRSLCKANYDHVAKLSLPSFTLNFVDEHGSRHVADSKRLFGKQ